VQDLPFAIVSGVYDLRDPRSVACIIDIVKQVENATAETVVLIVVSNIFGARHHACVPNSARQCRLTSDSVSAARPAQDTGS
jgi:hypothetical protein